MFREPIIFDDEPVEGESLEAKVDRLSRQVARLSGRVRLGRGARVAVGVAVVVAVFASGFALKIAHDQKVQRASNIPAACTQRNRAFDDYTKGLVRASGGDPKSPVIREKLKELPVQDCTGPGTNAYYKNSPKVKTCEQQGRVSDGKGFCVAPTTTTVP